MPANALILTRYRDQPRELQKQITLSRSRGRASIVWNLAQGFTLYHDSQVYPLSENADSALKQPREALRFILGRRPTQVDYIIEDFHHYIGSDQSLHPDIGEIRALIKEMAREFKSRSEHVYFLVPAAYTLPDELGFFFEQSDPTGTIKDGFLNKYGVLLTDQTRLAQSKPVIGVQDRIDRVIQILSQMEINNPLLVGQPGVGKTAIVEGFARALCEGRTPTHIKGRALYLISLNALIAGTKYRGEFEQRLEGLITDVKAHANHVIVFIDEIHTLLGAGSAEGAIGAGDALKPALARGEFPCIGATTCDGAQILLKDQALARRFKKISINESSPEQTYVILKGISAALEKHHGLQIQDSALLAAVYLSEKHIPDEYFPGKAIALLDAAAAFCGINQTGKVGEKDIAMEIERMVNM
jgi:ATP-dependent Clp protease ATP-binding subunit ClpA